VYFAGQIANLALFPPRFHERYELENNMATAAIQNGKNHLWHSYASNIA
jgi:hypothetical protein